MFTPQIQTRTPVHFFLLAVLTIALAMAADGQDKPFLDEEDHIGLRKAGVNEYRSRHYQEARVLLERAISLAQKGNDQFESALAYSALGDISQEELRFKDAEQLYRKGISILLLQPNQSHALAILWRNLASVLIIQTRYDDALAALKQSSKLVNANKLADPQLSAQILNSRGVVYFYQQQFGKAKTLFLHAAEFTLVPTEVNDLATEDILNNLATAYQITRQNAKAEETYKRALNLREIRLGHFHPGLATPLINLGSLCMNMRQYKNAEDHFLRAIAILEQPVTPVDEDLLMEALHGLARTYIREDEESRAEPVLRRASDIARRSLNQAILIPEIVEVLDDYSKVLRDLHDPMSADRLHTEAQRIRAAAAFTVEAKPKPQLR